MARRLGIGQENQYRWGLQNDVQYHNRVYVGQIYSIRTREGLMDVAISATGQKHRMVIPLGGLSAQQSKSAWQRFMPDVGDFVKVAFGPDNRPQCVGMAAWGHEESIGNPNTRSGAGGYHISGYARLSKLREENAPGLREWVELQPGEWDMRSSGGVYMKANRQGTWVLRAGCTKREHDKSRNEIRDRAGMWELEEGGSRMRFGDVKRQGQLTTPPSKAWEVDISHEKTLGVTTHYYEHFIGDLYDDSGLPELGPVGPTRIKQRVFDALSVSPLKNEVYGFRVDNIGNVSMDLGALATTHSQGGVLCRWTPSYNTVKIDGSVSSALTGAVVFLGTEGSIVNPLLLSTPYRVAEAAKHSALSTAHGTTLTTAFGAWLGAAQTLQAALVSSPPPASVGALVTLLTAYFTALVPAGGNTITAVVGGHTAAAAAFTTFEAPPAPLSYLSTQVFNT